jgi:hypothetical protein
MATIQLLIAGQRIQLTDVGAGMNEAFRQLYASYLAGVPMVLQAFESEVDNYFTVVAQGNSQHQDYFSNFTIAWSHPLQSGRFAVAEDLWAMALQPVIEYERRTGAVVHKGSPYYFFGVTALLRGDVDRGYAFMHQALDEDMRAAPPGSPLPRTPAAFFATLDDQNPDQYFRDWPVRQATYLTQRLAAYVPSGATPIDISAIRRRFLQNPPDNDAIFDLNYAVARFRAIEAIPAYALQSSFASQLQLSVLFELARIIEVAIKHKSRVPGQFRAQALALAKVAGLPLSQLEIEEASKRFSNDFELAMRELLDRTYRTAGGRSLAAAEIEICVAYGVRNRRGHSSASSAIVSRRFSEIESLLMCAFSRTVEHFY